MKMPSASVLQLAMACPASCSLPKVQEDRSSFADHGVKLHDVIDALYANGMDAAVELSKKLDVYADFMVIPSSLFLSLDNAVTESAFEYNPATGEYKDHGREGWEKFSGNSHIRGQADLVGTSGGRVVVVDWKTGLGPNPPAVENWQLIVAALVYCAKFGSKGATVKIVKTATGEVDVSEYEPEFLAAKAEELQYLSRLLSTDEHKTKFKTGEHCKYCKSWVYCPAQTTAIKRMGNVETGLTEELTAKNVEDAIANQKQLDDLSFKGQQQIRRYIELIGGELILPNGKKYVPAKAEGKYKRG